jgi:hypothetical protein
MSYIRDTTTSTGLTVAAHRVSQRYPLGVKFSGG